MSEPASVHAAQDSAFPKLPITVVSERALVRDLVVDFLRRHGFPHATGQATFRASSRAPRDGSQELVFVDLANERVDCNQLLRELQARGPGMHTVAMGTPLQLAAQGQAADGWIELSEPAAQLARLVASAAHPGHAAAKRPASAAHERWYRTWRSLTAR
jgi:DNA-binding NtrC family response regulator